MVQPCQLVGTMFELVHCDPEQTERERERELPCLSSSGSTATPLINFEKTEVVLGVSVCLGAQEEPG